MLNLDISLRYPKLSATFVEKVSVQAAANEWFAYEHGSQMLF